MSTGLLARDRTEPELAAVLAHEIAHLAARHGTRLATRAQTTKLASIPLVFMGGWEGGCIEYGGPQPLIPRGFQEQARENEKEADALAREYLSQAGYEVSRI